MPIHGEENVLIFFSLKNLELLQIYRSTYIPYMFLNHVEVYFEYEYACDIVGIWMFSKFRHTLRESDIKNYLFDRNL